MCKTRATNANPLNILLTNGRFPVSLDLARQLKLAGHHVYVVDCMHYHVCKFSRDVKRSFRVPVPHEDPSGFIEGVKRAVQNADIHLIIPLHEEIFCLAEAAESDEEIRSRLLSPPFDTLIRLHSKWDFSRFLTSCGLEAPHSVLCKSYQDVERLDRTREWALKPVFGRASMNIFHLKPTEPLPTPGERGFQIDDENHYVAQEWLRGSRYCSYSVLQDGIVVAFGVYPVQDTIDGSSCVYFESIEHNEIRAFVDHLAQALVGVSGQLAFDFVEAETGDPNSPTRLLPIECNPRATAGIHLWSGTPDLARVMTVYPFAPTGISKDRARRQLAPGMLMWQRTKGESSKLALKEYLRHMKHLMGSRDGKNLKLPTMFQYDLVWEPSGEYLQRIRSRLDVDEKREDEKKDQYMLTNLHYSNIMASNTMRHI
ncbi:hypothetical protein BDZ97DRAFT_1903600 [Flammula alnicola]|nr:hypothetical protein BDZ97DRAFT_1903600 [Flammula alnicola]